MVLHVFPSHKQVVGLGHLICPLIVTSLLLEGPMHYELLIPRHCSIQKSLKIFNPTLTTRAVAIDNAPFVS